MTDEELKIKESELKYAIGNLVDNLISYKGECDNQADRIAELEEENAELKEKLNFSTQYYQGEKAKEQLTKAKEIINDLLFFLNKFYSEDCPECMDKAEQFLSEVEK